jgi:hypothetical protein
VESAPLSLALVGLVEVTELPVEPVLLVSEEPVLLELFGEELELLMLGEDELATLSELELGLVLAVELLGLVLEEEEPVASVAELIEPLALPLPVEPNEPEEPLELGVDAVLLLPVVSAEPLLDEPVEPVDPKLPDEPVEPIDPVEPVEP